MNQVSEHFLSRNVKRFRHGKIITEQDIFPTERTALHASWELEGIDNIDVKRAPTHTRCPLTSLDLLVLVKINKEME